MALIRSQDNQFVYLSDHHTFGRMAEKVDTLVHDKFASRIHAVILWQELNWKVRDLSSNGTWVNGQRLPRNQLITLSQGDKIQFGSPQSDAFTMTEVTSPSDVLVSEENVPGSTPKILPLDIYHFFPNEENPELVLFKKNNLWFQDQLTESESPAQQLQNKDSIIFEGNHWTVRLVDNSSVTMQIEDLAETQNATSLKFEVSLDEEHCNLLISKNNEETDLGNHSHHLMTLMLARYRADDIKKQLPEADLGWVYLDQLGKDIGLEERHINIQIHRARKQLAEKLETTCSSTGLIERRRGQVRLGFSAFSIFKGGKLEYSNN